MRSTRTEDALDEAGVSAPLLDTAERRCNRAALADENAEALCTRDRGVEQGSRTHVRVRRRPRRDERRELRSLCPVHGERPGEVVRVERVGWNDDRPLALVERESRLAFLLVPLEDEADLAV